MTKKTATPVVDYLAGLLSGGHPPDTAIRKAREFEAAKSRDSADAIRVLNRRRVWDKKRKRLARSLSTGQAGLNGKSTLSSLLKDSDSINRKQVRVAAGEKSGGHKPKATALPDGWRPSPGHFGECDFKGVPHGVCDDAAAAMRNWTQAEAHRAISKKSNWNATFMLTWLGPAIQKWIKENRPSNRPRNKTFGDVMRGDA